MRMAVSAGDAGLWSHGMDIRNMIISGRAGVGYPGLADFCRSKTPSVVASSEAHDWPSGAQMMLHLCNYHTDGCGSIKLALLPTLPL